MIRDFSTAYYEDLGRQMLALVELVKRHCKEKQLAFIQEEIWANELAVALDELIAVLVLRGARLDPEVLERIRRLVDTMGMKSDDLERLERLAGLSSSPDEESSGLAP